MHGDGSGRKSPAGLSDNVVWRKSRLLDIPVDDSERFLDLAGFADGQLDPDDRERVAEWLAGDPIAAGDVAAARALAAAAERVEAAPEPIVARASSLVGAGIPQPDQIIPFAPRRRYEPGLRDMASWGSLAAAIALAAWLGFTLGVDTSRSFAQIGRAGEDGFLQELLDP